MLIRIAMQLSKAEIRQKLEREILPLQGFKPALHSVHLDAGLGPIRHAFPKHTFPLGTIHEFVCNDAESVAASIGFIAAIASTLIRNSGLAVWVTGNHNIFPPALKQFGIAPEKIIFVSCGKEQEKLYTIEEALRCNRVSVVIGELRTTGITESKRFQLAVEQSGVTGLLLHQNTKIIGATSSIARWKIEHLPGEAFDDLPGVCFPKWNVELLKVRNGKTGRWQIEWVKDSFRHVNEVHLIKEEQHRKAV